MKLFCIKSSSQMVQVIRLQYVINSNLYQGMCSKQGPTLRELCLHFRLREGEGGGKDFARDLTELMTRKRRKNPGGGAGGRITGKIPQYTY